LGGPASPSTWRGRTTSFTGVEDLRSQSRGWHRRDGPVGANRLVPVIMWALDHGACTETDPVAWRYRASQACG
jgi:hypothetical protein